MGERSRCEFADTKNPAEPGYAAICNVADSPLSHIDTGVEAGEDWPLRLATTRNQIGTPALAWNSNFVFVVASIITQSAIGLFLDSIVNVVEGVLPLRRHLRLIRPKPSSVATRLVG